MQSSIHHSGRRRAASLQGVLQGNSRYIAAAAAVLATILRFLLTGGLFITFMPDSNYDDMMQIQKALSLSAGEWLGEYGSMTLVKGPGYPLLTALFHTLGIPYLAGWTALYTIACAAFLYAVSPVIRNVWMRLLLYVALLYNPVAFSNQVNRYYRDAGYYAIAFLCIALFLGMLLHSGRRRAVLAGLGGFALGWAAMVREDSQWLFIYAAGCLAAVFCFCIFSLNRRFGSAVLACALIAAGYGAATVPVRMINYTEYGTFALDEYNSGSFAQSYGALSRLDGGLRDSSVTIPYAERMKLYEASPAFAELYPMLDAPDARYKVWKELQGEYRTGYFGFILRDAAQTIGKFESAETADAYFSQLAREVNDYADTVEGSGPRRSGIAARFYPEDLPAIFRSTVEACGAAIRFQNVSAIPLPVDGDDDFLSVYEEYTGSVCAANRYMEDTGEIVENYHLSGWRLWMQRGARVCILACQILTPVLFAAAFVLWLRDSVLTVLGRRSRDAVLNWVAVSSLLCAFVLREAMLGFVHCTTFPTLDNPAYQAASYALILAFAGLQLMISAPALADGVMRRLHRRRADA